MNAQEYYINIRPGNGFAETIKISQYDVGRPLAFHLMDGAGPLAIPSGSTVTIRGTKPSGLGFTEDCTISGSTASVSTTLGMSQEFGFFPVELVVAYNDDVIATGNAMLLVEMSPHQDGTTDGTAEDLQDIYEQIDDLKNDIENISGISDDVKTALLQIAQKVAYIDDDGADYYQDLYDALYPPAALESITAVYTQSGAVYDTASLDDLKTDLVVTAHWDGQPDSTVPSTDYSLSGTLAVGTSTVTVSYGGKTTTFTVTVSHAADPSEQWADGVAYVPTVIENKYISATSGAIESESGWDWTDYLPCKGARYIEVSALPQTYGQYANSNAFFGSDKTPVKTGVKASKTSVAYISVPSNAYWFGLSSEDTALASCINDGITPYASADWEDGVAYDDITVIQNKYIDVDHGGAETAYNGWDATDYVPCYGASTIVFSALNTGGSRAEYNAFFTKEKAYIQKIILNKTQSTTITVPANAYYFRLSSESAYLAACIANGIVPSAS